MTQNFLNDLKILLDHLDKKDMVSEGGAFWILRNRLRLVLNDELRKLGKED